VISYLSIDEKQAGFEFMWCKYFKQR
jgi:hypothetical protein